MANPEAPDLEALLAEGSESTNREYKGPYEWSRLKPKLIETILAMTNTKGGGDIVIGVTELKNGKFREDGMSDEMIKTFPSQEDFIAAVNAFADPHIDFNLYEKTHDKKRFLIVTVPESDTIPVFYREQVSPKKGRVYVRSTRKPENVSIQSPTLDDLRNLIDFAVERRTISFTKRAATSVSGDFTDEDWVNGTINQTTVITVPQFDQDSYLALAVPTEIHLVESLIGLNQIGAFSESIGMINGEQWRIWKSNKRFLHSVAPGSQVVLRAQ